MSSTDRIPALVLKMKALFSELNGSEQKVISYIIEHPEEVIYLSVSDLAEKSGSSTATVVRACRSVGMKGYQDLKLNLTQNIVTPLQSISEKINENDSITVVLDKVFSSTIHTLNYTRDVVDIKAVEEAVLLILNAHRIVVFGMGNSHGIATDVQHKFIRLGLNVVAFSDSHLQSMVSAHLSERDVVVAISHSGSSKDIIEAVKLAKTSNAKIISICNLGNSPLSRISDVKLFTASNETKYRIVALASRHAQMALIDVIYTMIAMKKGPDDAAKIFNKVEEALEHLKF